MKTGYKLELLSSEIMKVLATTRKGVDQDKNSENVPKLESVEVNLVHCNLVKNSYYYQKYYLLLYLKSNVGN